MLTNVLSPAVVSHIHERGADQIANTLNAQYYSKTFIIHKEVSAIISYPAYC